MSGHGIAEVYLTGIMQFQESPCFWIAMKYLPGGTIAEHARQQKIGRTEILSLFRSLCETIRQAHRLGVIHRDLKPGNVLVDQDGTPYVVDFGVATVLSSDNADAEQAAVVGTVSWMAPELLSGESVVADIRTDIYSLGCILFELISGQRIHGASNLHAGQVLARIQNSDPPSLSEHVPTVSPDLDAFTRALCERAPVRRYQNLDDVLLDLDRLLRNEPVSVREQSTVERLRRWCGRHRLAVSVSLVALMMLIPWCLWYVVSLNELTRYDTLLRANNQQLTEQAENLERTALLRERSQNAARLSTMLQKVFDSPDYALDYLQDEGLFPSAYRGAAWNLLCSLATPGTLDLKVSDQALTSIRFSHSGDLLAAIDSRGILSICNVPEQRVTAVASGFDPESQIVFAPDDAAAFAVLTGGHPGFIDPGTMTSERLVPLPAADACRGPIACSLCGELLVCAARNRRFHLINVPTRELRATVTLPNNSRKVVGVWIHPDGTHFSGVTPDGLWYTWEYDSLKLVSTVHISDFIGGMKGLTQVLFRSCADGQSLLVLRRGEQEVHYVRLNPNPLGESLGSVALLNNEAESAHVASPDSLLVLGSHHAVLRNHMRRKNDRVFQFGDRHVSCGSIHEAGERLAVGDLSGRVTIRELRMRSACTSVGNPSRDFVGYHGSPLRVLPLPDSTDLIVATIAGQICCHDRATGQLKRTIPLSNKPISAVAVSVTKDWLAAGDNSRESLVILPLSEVRRASPDSVAVPEIVRQLPVGRIRAMAVSSAESRLTLGTRDGRVVVVDTDSWEILDSWQAHEDGVYSLQVSDAFIATGSGSDGRIRLWDPESHELIAD